jgi:hypothetical protein
LPAAAQVAVNEVKQQEHAQTVLFYGVGMIVFRFEIKIAIPDLNG